jgi:hypothetical protein
MEQGVYMAGKVVEIKPVIIVGCGVLKTMFKQDHFEDSLILKFINTTIHFVGLIRAPLSPSHVPALHHIFCLVFKQVYFLFQPYGTTKFSTLTVFHCLPFQ